MAPIPFEPGAIRMLAKLMSETGLTEIELAEKDRRIRVVRGVAQAPMQQVVVPHAAPESDSRAVPRLQLQQRFHPARADP